MIQLARLPLAATLAAALIAFAGCSGSSESTNSSHETRSESDWGSAAGTATPPPPNYDGAAERAVRAYYSALSDKRFETAWDRLGADVQAQFGGYETWVDGQATTVAVRPTSVFADAGPRNADVSVELKTVDEDYCGDRVTQRFAGTWSLRRVAGRWLATDVTMKKIAGATPVSVGGTCTSPPEPAEDQFCTKDIHIPAIHIPGDRSLGLPPETIPAETIPGECYDLSEDYTVLADNYESIDPDYSRELTYRYRSQLSASTYRTPDYTAPGYGELNEAGYPKNQYVSSYFRDDGTYVSGYWRNSPTDGYYTCRVIDC